MQEVLVITVKGNFKYQFDSEKSVEQVMEEIEASNGFYFVYENCALKKEEIVSVEKFQVNIEEDDNDKTKN